MTKFSLAKEAPQFSVHQTTNYACSQRVFWRRNFNQNSNY